MAFVYVQYWIPVAYPLPSIHENPVDLPTHNHSFVPQSQPLTAFRRPHRPHLRPHSNSVTHFHSPLATQSPAYPSQESAVALRRHLTVAQMEASKESGDYSHTARPQGSFNMTSMSESLPNQSHGQSYGQQSQARFPPGAPAPALVYQLGQISQMGGQHVQNVVGSPVYNMQYAAQHQAMYGGSQAAFHNYQPAQVHPQQFYPNQAYIPQQHLPQGPHHYYQQGQYGSQPQSFNNSQYRSQYNPAGNMADEAGPSSRHNSEEYLAGHGGHDNKPLARNPSTGTYLNMQGKRGQFADVYKPRTWAHLRHEDRHGNQNNQATHCGLEIYHRERTLLTLRITSPVTPQKISRACS